MGSPIPAQPPKEAIEARSQQANRAAKGEGDHYHTVANPSMGEKPGERGLDKGYRPEVAEEAARQEDGGEHLS